MGILLLVPRGVGQLEEGSMPTLKGLQWLVLPVLVLLLVLVLIAAALPPLQPTRLVSAPLLSLAPPRGPHRKAPGSVVQSEAEPCTGKGQGRAEGSSGGQQRRGSLGR